MMNDINNIILGQSGWKSGILLLRSKKMLRKI